MLRVAQYFSAKFNDTDTNNQYFVISGTKKSLSK